MRFQTFILSVWLLATIELIVQIEAIGDSLLSVSSGILFNETVVHIKKKNIF